MWKVSPSNTLLSTYSYTGSAWHFPTGVCVDPSSPSSLYIVDNAQGYVYLLDSTNGTVLSSFYLASSPLYSCRIAHGRLYTVNIYLDSTLKSVTRILQLHLNGTLAASLTIPFPASGRDIAVDSSGHMYVATEYDKVVLKVDPQGVVVATFSVDGWYPTGVCVDGADRVWVFDPLNACVWQLTTAGCSREGGHDRCGHQGQRLLRGDGAEPAGGPVRCGSEQPPRGAHGTQRHPPAGLPRPAAADVVLHRG